LNLIKDWLPIRRAIILKNYKIFNLYAK